MLICLNAVAECGQSEREEMENCMMELSAGNTAAMEPLYRIANPSVYAFALSLLKNSHDAEEIAQECFARLPRRGGIQAPRQADGLAYNNNQKSVHGKIA